MSDLLIKNIHTLVTEVGEPPRKNSDLLIEDNKIARIEDNIENDSDNVTVIDGKDMLFMPGLVNTHHHFYQTMNRNIPAVQNAKLFDWLTYLYEIWKYLTPEMARISAQVASAELILSGCTTAVDHFYVFPNKHQEGILEAEIEAVEDIGLRFHPTRGSMSLSTKDGGLPPDSVVQDEDTILSHTQEVIEKYHQPEKFGMTRIIVAPCSPFSVTASIMKESKQLGEKYENVIFQTHLAETIDEEEFCLEQTGMRPFDYLESLGWMDEKCLHVHSIHLNKDEVRRMGAAGAAMSHCPSSNMRLGSGMAPIVDMLEAGVNVSLGVDGSASNDSSHMFAEARQALLLQRINYDEESITSRDVLRAATVGGAKAVGRDDIGSLAPGMAADLVGVNLRKIDFAGAMHDPLAALVFCHPPKVDWSIINGEIIVKKGEFLPLDLGKLVDEQNRLAEEQISQIS
jgi:cytosine/adenosine deaminase-related metal-dependent hydrolase